MKFNEAEATYGSGPTKDLPATPPPFVPVKEKTRDERWSRKVQLYAPPPLPPPKPEAVDYGHLDRLIKIATDIAVSQRLAELKAEMAPAGGPTTTNPEGEGDNESDNGEPAVEDASAGDNLSEETKAAMEEVRAIMAGTDFGDGPSGLSPKDAEHNDDPAVNAFTNRPLTNEDLGSGTYTPGFFDRWFGGVIGYWAGSNWSKQQLARAETLGAGLLVSDFLLAECKAKIFLSQRNGISAVNTRMALYQSAKAMKLNPEVTEKLVAGTMLSALSVHDKEQTTTSWLEYCPRVRNSGLGFLSDRGLKKECAVALTTRRSMWVKTAAYGLPTLLAVTGVSWYIWSKVSGPSSTWSILPRIHLTWTTAAPPTSTPVCETDILVTPLRNQLTLLRSLQVTTLKWLLEQLESYNGGRIGA